MNIEIPERLWPLKCLQFVCGLCRCIHYGVPWPWASLPIVLGIHLPYCRALCEECLVLNESTHLTMQLYTVVERIKYICLKNIFQISLKVSKRPIDKKNTSLFVVVAWRIPSYKTNSVQSMEDKFKWRFCLWYRCSCKTITSQNGCWIAISTNVLVIVNRLSYKRSVLYFTEFSLTGYEHHIAHYRGQRANPSITKNLKDGRPLDLSRTLFVW